MANTILFKVGELFELSEDTIQKIGFATTPTSSPNRRSSNVVSIKGKVPSPKIGESDDTLKLASWAQENGYSPSAYQDVTAVVEAGGSTVREKNSLMLLSLVTAKDSFGNQGKSLSNSKSAALRTVLYHNRTNKIVKQIVAFIQMQEYCLSHL